MMHCNDETTMMMMMILSPLYLTVFQGDPSRNLIKWSLKFCTHKVEYSRYGDCMEAGIIGVKL